ncbi:hypothetical protein BJ742DRAFT_883158 [Cladochytrium replicatum]|nr:hypothetical protein BJ742DRAFT_883158 [Cladochytrium replicatum]
MASGDFTPPLLDVSGHVGEEHVQKVLAADDATLANASHENIYTAFLNRNPMYVAGVGAQNVIRNVWWLLMPTLTMCGSDTAQIQRDVAAKDRVKTEDLVDESTGTGYCAVMITATKRKLFAHAKNYGTANIKEIALKPSQILQLTGRYHVVVFTQGGVLD